MTEAGQYRYPAKEDLGSFRRLLHVALLIATVLPLAIVTWQLCLDLKPEHQPSPISSSAQPARRSVIPIYVALPTQRLFPYSVIPGGATDAQELENAVNRDPVVAAHYADFDAAKVRVVRLDHNRAVYVSYRLGNRVYWTTRTLGLLKGETVLTDGEHEARTRCGNRISESPRLPVSLKEPETAMLEKPVPELGEFGALPEAVGNLPFPLVAPLGGPATSSGGLFFVPPFIPIIGGSGTPTTSGTQGGPGGPGTPVTPVPPVTTPEPATLLLVSGGFLAAWLTRRHTQS